MAYNEMSSSSAAWMVAHNELTAAVGKIVSIATADDLSLRILIKVKSLSDRALKDEIRRQLQNLVGPNWNQNCIVGYCMIEIVRELITRLIEEGRAREIVNIAARLKTRFTCGGGDEVCSICLNILDGDREKYGDQKIIATLDCRHEYHVECIIKWLVRGKNFCPFCKARALEVDGDGLCKARPLEVDGDGQYSNLQPSGNAELELTNSSISPAG